MRDIIKALMRNTRRLVIDDMRLPGYGFLGIAKQNRKDQIKSHSGQMNSTTRRGYLRLKRACVFSLMSAKEEIFGELDMEVPIRNIYVALEDAR